jgi:hypothetical protein
MGIIAWIVLGLAAGLIANMLIPGRRQQGLILTCAIGILAHRHRRRGCPAARLSPVHPTVQPVQPVPPVHPVPPVRPALRPATGGPG